MTNKEYEIEPGKESDEMIKRVNKLVLGISFLFNHQYLCWLWYRERSGNKEKF